ncbi:MULTISPECIES: argininosuccinate lyase [Bremerella]|uniref:argininosuccinate lyase n=1 Tax=Bremerella TaxID=2714594 RepID=UPI0031EC8701
MSRNSPSQSGVFSSAVDARVEKFTESISFDHRLYAQDIRGSIAHAEMLADVGVLTQDEATQITTALALIKGEIENGEFQFDEKLEDVHMNIESALVARLGDVGRKLHTGRSRNDQVSTDARLWVRDAIDQTDKLLEGLQKAFVGRCEADMDVILPAYTHMQRAQPVLAPHYWLAYTEKFQRDRERLADCRRRVNVCSLGTAALAGTTIPIDRDNVARRLEFEAVAANSIDVSSDRDFLVEYAFCLTMIAEHLSVWADEWVLWSSVEFKFIKIPQQFCTGSSIMPQKINPDVCELIRGKSARVIGNLQALLVLIKGLPLAYNRDLQEDKERLFDSVDTVHRSLDLAASIVEGAQLNVESINSRLEDGFLDATTLMEYLIGKGTPQRTAHHQIGSLVATAMDKGCRLADLPLDEFTAVNESLDKSVYDVLGVAKAVAAFRSYGSTSPGEVKKQVVRWKEQLELS